jgi:hypothetical protein
MRPAKDWLLLVAAAVAILIATLAVRMALEPLEQATNWFAAIWFTVFIFGIGAPRLFKRPRPWSRATRILAAVLLGLLLLHGAVYWTVIYYLTPRLRAPEWALILIVEIWLLSQVMGWAEAHTRKRRI